MHITKYTGPLCRTIFGVMREHPLSRKIRDTVYANIHSHRTFFEITSFPYALCKFTAGKPLTFGPSRFRDPELTICVTVDDELNGGVSYAQVLNSNFCDKVTGNYFTESRFCKNVSHFHKVESMSTTLHLGRQNPALNPI